MGLDSLVALVDLIGLVGLGALVAMLRNGGPSLALLAFLAFSSCSSSNFSSSAVRNSTVLSHLPSFVSLFMLPHQGYPLKCSFFLYHLQFRNKVDQGYPFKECSNLFFCHFYEMDV